MRLLSQRSRLLTFAILLGLLAGTLAVARPARAAGYGYWMIKSEVYGKCLSTNLATSPAGGVTHQVYLTTCNPATTHQWWQVNVGGLDDKVTSWVKDDGYYWELSANGSPLLGVEGIHAVYTARQSDVDGHKWTLGSGGPIEFINRSKYENTQWLLSASDQNPYAGGGYRVYTSKLRSPAAPAQWWVLTTQNSAGPPPCATCIVTPRS
ncbi:hypothetical protein [Actinoplanes sp. L3-i22]|uniref:hypothetical protein n=1 Tax=Actinoplanes sp. L3-i22 TaxID=2836373 RepID=UPI001C863FC2|nr:hypothetical protein [Actinoplanes sp. L3-i22]